MSDQPLLRHDDIVSYIHLSVVRLARQWNAKHMNNSGLRATFRRWHPNGQDHSPSMEMRSEIWARMGLPVAEGASPSDDSPTPQQLDIIDRAATIVALRAMIGEHPGAERSFGAALHDADLSDLRLMRLLTTPIAGRLEAMIRAAKRLDADNAAIAWNKREVARFNDFLFENEDRAKQAIDRWAADFFRVRGTMAAKESNEPTTIETSTN